MKKYETSAVSVALWTKRGDQMVLKESWQHGEEEKC